MDLRLVFEYGKGLPILIPVEEFDQPELVGLESTCVPKNAPELRVLA